MWTWANGPDRVAEHERIGIYGTKGVAAPENVPGARREAVTWRDASGSLWLFGGYGFAGRASQNTLNDLWKWDGTAWTWVGGSNQNQYLATYGTKGVPAPENNPGGRYGAASWVDASGNLWLFGGGSQIESQALGDLWRWDGANWTWMSGANVPSQPGIYGTKGVAAPENQPGARRNAAAWVDASGHFWLFGGRGVPSYASGNKDLNDLWKWDGTNWTWMGGSNIPGQPGVYGTKGTASPTNVPGARYWTTSCVGPGGTVWLQGGYGYGATGFGLLNDLWMWDGANWTWVSGSDAPNQSGVYGSMGVAAAANVPGARQRAASWSDPEGNLWLLGGTVLIYPTATSEDLLNDLWRWDGANWTWMKGSDAPGRPGVYGTKGVPALANEPGARYGALTWAGASGGVSVFGGSGASSTGNLGPLNDLWQWDGSEWTWRSGPDGASQAGVYGTKGLPSPANRPGARTGAVSWHGASGETWLFGGHGYSAAGLGYLNDLWRWDGSTWTWMSGSDREDQPGVFGTKGVPATENIPGARGYAVAWSDAEGNLWLFGGNSPDPNGEGLRNDLWRWDGANWTWMSGSSSRGGYGVYGTIGVPAPANVPGSRSDAVAWTDSSGSLWLFGGLGRAGTDWGDLNDLWRWDGTNWTWMHGANAPGALGFAGVRGIPAADNDPASRTGALCSAAADGTVWLFGGEVGSHYLKDDLWRWDGTFWTWMGGTHRYFGNGVYGEKGVAAPGNQPGSRAWGTSWTDASGYFWLLGGNGSTDLGRGALNDLWRWDGSTWTWMSGADRPNSAGVYGEAGIPAAANEPGARNSPAAWRDEDGRLLLLGGYGSDASGARGRLADLWAYEVPSCSPPSAAIAAPDSILEGSGGHTAAVPDAGVGAAYEWAITGGVIDTGQGMSTISFSPTPGATNTVVSVLVRVGECSTSGEKSILVGEYLRLEVIRNGSGNVYIFLGSSWDYCEGSCVAFLEPGAAVNLIPQPFPNSRFAGWLGGPCSGTGTCSFPLTEPTTVSAAFFQKEAAGFSPVTPCRVADTRSAAGPYGAPALAAGVSRAFTVGGTCGIPLDATAVALNVTVTGPTDAGSLTIYPGMGPAPETGSLHFATERTRANNVTMGLAGGVLSILDRQVAGTVEVIIDVSGYYR